MIIILALAIVTFIGSMVLNQGKAYRSDGTLSTVVLQILNGCGEGGASETLARALLPGDGSIMYDVIEKANAKFKAFDKTIVVDRHPRPTGEPSEKSIMIASRMGIEEEDIILLKLADNILKVDVTVIAGTDYMDYVYRLDRSKEESL